MILESRLIKHEGISNEEIAELIKRLIPAWPIELLKFYRIILSIFEWGCPLEKFFGYRHGGERFPAYSGL